MELYAVQIESDQQQLAMQDPIPYRCFAVVQLDASGQPLLRQKAHLRDDELVELYVDG